MDAKCSINLDVFVTNEIQTKLDSDQIDRKSFHEAQQHIFKLMENDCVSKFYLDLSVAAQEMEKRGVTIAPIGETSEELAQYFKWMKISEANVKLERLSV